MHKTENDSSSTLEKKDQNSSNNSNCSNKNMIMEKVERYCHIVKRPDFDGYGFNLHSEKIKLGQYIGKVDANSPAEAAGLREGDQIIEVNGVAIGNETHKQVVQRIKAISNEVRLLLVDPAESVKTNFKSRTDINEENTETTKPKTNANSMSSNKISTSKPNSPTVPAKNNSTVEVNIALPEQKGNSMASLNSPFKQQADVTDFLSGPTNGHHQKKNGQPLEQTKSTSESTSHQQRILNESQNESQMIKPGLNLNLTAAEMRAKLLAKKKYDPKNESVDLKKKFDIIQKL